MLWLLICINAIFASVIVHLLYQNSDLEQEIERLEDELREEILN